MWVRQIHRVKVEGGFMDGTDVRFSSGFNCIIGARGTGKSTLLKLICFALGNLPAQGKASGRFLTEIEQVLGSGRVSVWFVNQLDNERILQRTPGRYPRLFDLEGNILQEGCELQFHFEAYHQGELENLLDNGPSALLNMLDKTVADLDPLLLQASDNLNRRKQIQKAYEAKAEELIFWQEKMEQQSLLHKELDCLDLQEPERRLAAIEKEKGLLDFWEKFLVSRLRSLKSLLDGDYSTCQLHNEEFINPDLIQQLEETVNICLEVRHGQLQEVIRVLENGLDSITCLRALLHERHQVCEAEIQHTLQQQGFKKAEEARRQRFLLLEQLGELLGCGEEYNRFRRQLDKLNEQKQQLLHESRQLWSQIINRRQQSIDNINYELDGNPYLKYKPASGREEYRNFLFTLLQGKFSRKLIDGIVRCFSPQQLIDLVAGADEDLLTQKTSFTSQEARHLLWLLGTQPHFAAVTECELQDQVHLYYQPDHESIPVSSLNLSRGMQCSLLLPVVLLGRQQMLMGDQFEDNLDNACIYDLIIPRIQNIKLHRQLILVTHNPNIVVAGVADRVIVTQSNGNQAGIKMQGNLNDEHIKGEIIALLEGGREAFHQRIEYLGVG